MHNTRIPLITILACMFLVACELPSGKEGQAQQLQKDTVDLQFGNRIRDTAFQLLSTALTSSIQTAGIAATIPFCQMNASSLLDEIRQTYQVRIDRVTNKPRNLDHKVNEDEEGLMRDFQRQIIAGNHLEPVLYMGSDNVITYYSPIRIQPLCLSCHGQIGLDVAAETLIALKDLYPEDQAIGYELGDLRGMWRISWMK